ncbi:coatomer subunit delta-like [Clavelina lepadiformis]|uniref:coatomer subunit delta-like n=1 Tax=Clavelina lepadiformis TaxID=159417 RepID=UPI0040435219
MVLLAAAVCSKNGRALISRQFVEMTRSRIEGLLAAFPKLMNTGKQHTFVETESVRYVYQPLEKMYMVLITTKNSNILEDLETLRLFSRVIPEYCRVIDEADIQEHAFELIFAFDEVVALGYRESVNLAQIRTFTEMDSHEEKVFNAVRETQVQDAKMKMRQRAKEIKQKQRDTMRGGRMGGSAMGYGSSNASRMGEVITQSIAPEPTKPKSVPSRSSGKAMKLGAKSKDVDQFVDKLISEGENVRSTGSLKSKKMDIAKTSVPAALTESVHIRIEEKLNITAGRDGGLQQMIMQAMCWLRIADDQYGCIFIKVDNNDDKGCQFQTHPKVDKKAFLSSGIIGLKDPDKPFPLKQDVGILKWGLKATDESLMPLAINCWPNDNGEGGCDVNIEYELQLEELELIDVCISIPVPSGVGAPNIADLDGDFKHDSRKNILEWTLPVIDASNNTGSMEFSIAGSPDDFFPINVSFHSTKKSFTDIQITGVEMAQGRSPVKYSSESALLVEKYEIV